LSAVFVGFAVGAALLGLVGKRLRFRRGWAGCVALPLYGLSAFVLGRAGGVAGALTAAAVMGIFLGVCNVTTNYGIQALVPQELQGRVNGFITTVVYGFMPLGYLAGGLLADRFATGAVISVAGLALAVTSLTTFILPGMKDIP